MKLYQRLIAKLKENSNSIFQLKVLIEFGIISLEGVSCN
jgi:hypothetical protein